MLVRRGIVARALMDPLHADPLLVSLSGPRALCGSCETLYVQTRSNGASALVHDIR